MANIAEFSGKSSLFNDMIKSNTLPVLVDFWASWCGPCRALSPVLEKVSVQYQDKLNFVKVNVDSNEELSNEYNIRSIPSLLLFKNGKVIATHLGGLSEKDLIKFLDDNL